MDLLQETKFLMNKYHITASKALGQNFLIDEEAVNGIVENAEVCERDLVIEIGPGLGNLTTKLLEKAGKVLCIELDEKMITILKDRFSLYKNFELINEDVLKVDLSKLIEENLHDFNLKKAKVVANLPYYITTPIIMSLLENRLNLESITVMVQKEVAQRLADVPGGKFSGAITYSVNYFSDAEIVLEVPRTSFVPVPEVDSAVVKFSLLSKPRVTPKDENLFFKIIKSAFLQRRKTLVNALYNEKIMQSKTEIEDMLKAMDIDTKVRGEKLTLEQFAQIADFIENKRR